MIRKPLIALSTFVAAAGFAAPAHAEVVRVHNDGVIPMALTNVATAPGSGTAQMQRIAHIPSQAWTQEFDGVFGPDSFRLRSGLDPSLCLGDRNTGAAIANIRLTSCNAAPREISWKLSATRQLRNVSTARLATVVLPASPTFAAVQMRLPGSTAPWTLMGQRWTIRPCSTPAC